jgi:hypothetical protein
MEIKVLNTMHQAIIKIKTDSESESVFFLSSFNSNCGTLFIENINIPTPVEIAISATLKMALKVKSLPPQIGNQLGRLPFQMEIKHINYFTVNRRHKAVLKTM